MADPNPTERLLEQARNRPGFMDRLAKRLQEDKPILDRLEAMEHDEANAITEATMVAIRRLANHRHRYPQTNAQGFPPSQCLDCGYWRTPQSGRGQS